MKHLSILLFLLLLSGCESGDKSASDLILNEGRVHILSSKPLLLPCSQLDGSVEVFEVRRWDIIFLGWDFRGVPSDSAHPIHAAIPGPYDHAMVYLGKDAYGIGYIAEVTTSTNSNQLITEGDDIYWSGQLYIRALGTDYLESIHPSAERFFNGRNYNHASVRALTPEARAQLDSKRTELFDRIQADFLRKVKFQVPIVFDVHALLQRNELTLDDDGYENGAFCVDYWSDLYAKIGGVCFKETRMNAAAITEYFLEDPAAQYAVISSSQNPTGLGSINVAEFAQTATLLDPPPHICPVDGHVETGVVAPTYMHDSPDLTEPTTVSFSGSPANILPLP